MGRLLPLWLAIPLALRAATGVERQQQTYASFDLHGRATNGRIVEIEKGEGWSRTVEKIRDVNGRWVPLQEVEERLLQAAGPVRILERWIRPYDQNGRPGPPEKVRIEEQELAPGRKLIRQLTYRGDLNGHLEAWEQREEQVEQQEGAVRKQATVQRRGPGGWQLVEKTEETERRTQDRILRESTVYRKDVSGHFYPAARLLSETVQKGSWVREVVDEYNAARTGKLEFAWRRERETRHDPSGAATTVIRVYGAAPPGRPVTGEPSPQLREEQFIHRTPTTTGYVETVQVRRASLSDPGRLEAPLLVSRVVCQGKCQDGSSAQQRDVGSPDPSRGPSTSASQSQTPPAKNSQSTSPRK